MDPELPKMLSPVANNTGLLTMEMERNGHLQRIQSESRSAGPEFCNQNGIQIIRWVDSFPYNPAGNAADLSNLDMMTYYYEKWTAVINIRARQLAWKLRGTNFITRTVVAFAAVLSNLHYC